MSASFLHALQTNMSWPGRDREKWERFVVVRSRGARASRGRRNRVSAGSWRTRRSLAGGSSRPRPWLQPGLCTGRRPHPDPLATLPHASLQHLWPGTEGGMGVRGELRAGPSPGDEMLLAEAGEGRGRICACSGVGGCPEVCTSPRCRGRPSELWENTLLSCGSPERSLEASGKASWSLNPEPCTRLCSVAGHQPLPWRPRAASGHRCLGPSHGSSKIISGFC